MMTTDSVTGSEKVYPQVYPPGEDSFLILKYIKNYVNSKDIVLDMCTGSGILAREAAKYSKKVFACDINPKAAFSGKNIEFIESDLFSNIARKFDLIICNPPYLPNDPEIADIALDGGEKGYEFTERFLIAAKNHLTKKGKILLLFSSLTKKGVLDKILQREGYIFEQVGSQKLDFEELYVYIIPKKW